jgi:hypothetical protein
VSPPANQVYGLRHLELVPFVRFRGDHDAGDCQERNSGALLKKIDRRLVPALQDHKASQRGNRDEERECDGNLPAIVIDANHSQHLHVDKHQQQILQRNCPPFDVEVDFLGHGNDREVADHEQEQIFGLVNGSIDKGIGRLVL